MEHNFKFTKTLVCIVCLSVVGRLLGFAKEAAIGGIFGTTGYTDAYFLAIVIPTIIASAVGITISYAFIPLYTKIMGRYGLKEGACFFRTVTLLMIIIVGLMAVPIFVFSREIISAFAPGFDSLNIQRAVDILRIVMPMAIFLSLASLFQAALNSNNQFVVPAAAGTFSNLVIILSIFTLGKVWGLYGVAFGALLGAITLSLVQIFSIVKLKLMVHLKSKRPINTMAEFYQLLIPLFFGALFMQANALVDRFLASNLEDGSISVLNFAVKINWLPLGIFVSAVAVIVYPRLSATANYAQKEDFHRLFTTGLNAISGGILPITCAFMLLSIPIVRVLFERGLFLPEATRLTAQALCYYAIGLPFLAWGEMFRRGFWAMGNSKIPMRVDMATVIINIFLSINLVEFLGIRGLALSTSISVIFNTICLAYIFIRQRDYNIKPAANRLLAFFIALIPFGFLFFIAEPFIVSQDSIILLLACVLSVSSLGLVMYAFCAYLLGVREMKDLMSVFKGEREIG